MEDIDSLLDFNPSDTSAFDSPVTSENNAQSNLFYRPNVKNSTSDDKHYRATIRLIYNPKDFNRSIVERTTYNLKDAQGNFYADSLLSNGDKSCPIFKAWKQLHYSGKPELEIHTNSGDNNWFDRSTRRHILIQVIKDDNKPELNGKFLIWALKKNILTMLDTKFYKPADPKKKVFLLDYLIGPALSLDIAPAKAGEPEFKVDYAASEFDTDIQPIIATDGKPLFTSDEMDVIEKYNEAKTKVIKAKSDEDVAKGNATIAAIKDELRTIFTKAVQYVTDNAPDLVVEGGYHPWSEELNNRVAEWIANVTKGIDPTSVATTHTATTVAPQPAAPQAIPTATTDTGENKDDLPF